MRQDTRAVGCFAEAHCFRYQPSFSGSGSITFIRDREPEHGTCSGFRPIRPDPAAVMLYDTLANRQSHAAARVLIAAVKTFEQSENLRAVFRIDPDSVVGDRERPPA